EATGGPVPSVPPPSRSASPARPTERPPAASPATASTGRSVGRGTLVSPPDSPNATASGAAALFPGGLLIADRGNGRLLVVDAAGHVLWRFPTAGSLPRGQRFSADDAFIAPDGRTIVANDENHQVIDRIDIRTRRVVWQFGVYDRPGAGSVHLHTPDDAYPLANGDVVVADIRNCRILEIAPSKRIV